MQADRTEELSLNTFQRCIFENDLDAHYPTGMDSTSCQLPESHARQAHGYRSKHVTISQAAVLPDYILKASFAKTNRRKSN